MPKMRTIDETYKYIKNSDPNTCLTPYALRRMVLNGTIPSVRSGKKFLLDISNIDDFFCGSGGITQGAIRPIPEKIRHFI